MVFYPHYISPGFIIFLGIIMIWSMIWKGFGMWKAAEKKSPAWFVILFIINTLGILDILYIYVFSKYKKVEEPKRKKRK